MGHTSTQYMYVYVSFAESVERVIRWNGETLEIKTEGKLTDRYQCDDFLDVIS